LAEAAPARLPAARVVVTLLAGRGVFRLAFYAAGLGLLALWGEDEFARYATATGAVAWLSALLAGGVEKAGLALIPRPDGAALPRLFAVLAVAPLVVLTGGWLVLAAFGSPEPLVRYAAAAALTCGTGSCAVLVALYRLRGIPYLDALAYLTLAGIYAAVVAMVAATQLNALAVLTVLVVAVVMVNAGLLAGLWRQLPTTWPTWPVGLAATRASAVLGTAEVLSTVSVSVLYALFALAGDAADIGLFYTLAVVSSVVSVAWAYLLRLVQPALVGWLVRVGSAVGWRWASRVLDATVLLGIPGAVALLIAVWSRGGGFGLAVTAQVLEIFLAIPAMAAAVILENIDAAGRRWSAAGALSHVITVAVSGWWLVPAAGVAGGVTALVLGELIRALFTRGMITAAVQRQRRAPAITASPTMAQQAEEGQP
jgi:hypothetical protein